MTQPAADCKGARLDRWPVAGIATACVDRLKTLLSERFLPPVGGQLRFKDARNSRDRRHMGIAPFALPARSPSPDTGAALKTP